MNYQICHEAYEEFRKSTSHTAAQRTLQSAIWDAFFAGWLAALQYQAQTGDEA